MARRGRGVGGGNRLPLRGFAKLLTNLPPTTRDRLESAFAEAEDLVGFHALAVPEKIVGRKLSGFLESPVLEVVDSILGSSVKWARLQDPRIIAYEIQVDSVNVFPNPSTFLVREPFFSVENLTTRRFVRVRGLRPDKQVGNWSNTVSLKPTGTAPVMHSVNFYQRYSGSLPDLVKPVLYGGEPTPQFYTLFESSFYPTRNTGGMSIFGTISNRLSGFRDSDVRPWDRVKFSVNGLSHMENYFCHWTDAFGDADTASVLPGFYPFREPLSFYSRGGYTAALTPTAVVYPIGLRGDGWKDPRKVEDRDAPGATFYWSEVKSVRRPSIWDVSVLDNEQSGETAAECVSRNITTRAETSYIICKDFGLKVPEDKQITGIKVGVKRRSAFQEQFSFDKDRGNASPNLPLEPGGAPPLSDDDIFTDPNFGRAFGDLGNGGRRLTISNSSSLGVSNSWTHSFWVQHVKAPQAGATIHLYSGGTPQPAAFILSYQELVTAGFPSTTYDLNLTVGYFLSTQLIHRFEDVWGSVGGWDHIVTTWDGSTLRTYINGSFKAPDRIEGSSPAPLSDGPRTQIRFPETSNNNYSINFGPAAWWDTPLDSGAISSIFDSRGNGDYTFPIGNYSQTTNLKHYWLSFPDDADIRDKEIRLIDSADTIRMDLEEKSIQTETWPRLSDFENAARDEFFYGIPIAVSRGIPHDSVMGIGYQEYGGQNDLWGAEHHIDDFYAVLLDPAALNSENFGVAIRAQNVDNTFAGHAMVDHVRMQVFWEDTTPRIDLKVEAEASNHFYLNREFFGGIINAIEVGEKPL
jgi:hypothetical protein